MITATRTKSAMPAALCGNWPMMSCCLGCTNESCTALMTYTATSASGIVQKKALLGLRNPHSDRRLPAARSEKVHAAAVCQT